MPPQFWELGEGEPLVVEGVEVRIGLVAVEREGEGAGRARLDASQSGGKAWEIDVEVAAELDFEVAQAVGQDGGFEGLGKAVVQVTASGNVALLDRVAQADRVAQEDAGTRRGGKGRPPVETGEFRVEAFWGESQVAAEQQLVKGGSVGVAVGVQQGPLHQGKPEMSEQRRYGPALSPGHL